MLVSGENAFDVRPVELSDLGRAHAVKCVAGQPRCRDLTAARVYRCRAVRAELFGKARLELVQNSRRILERAVLAKLQAVLNDVEQQLRRTRPGPCQLARYLPVSRIKPDRRLELFVLSLKLGKS